LPRKLDLPLNWSLKEVTLQVRSNSKRPSNNPRPRWIQEYNKHNKMLMFSRKRISKPILWENTEEEFTWRDKISMFWLLRRERYDTMESEIYFVEAT
jgi:hypothetical protein